MLEFPKSLEKVLLSYIRTLAAQKKSVFAKDAQDFNDKDLRFFSKAVRQLSDLFTKERAELPSGYLNHLPWHIAYLLYFLPINFSKACFVFQKFPKSFWQRSNFKLLDLGCGPASASLAFLHCLSQKNKEAEVEIHLLDQNRKILGSAQDLLKNWQENEKLIKKTSARLESKNLLKARFQQRFDLIIFHHVINEMTSLGALERAEWLHPFLSQHLTDQGLVAIIEPALKRPTRELMALRDHLIEESWEVLAPCLHQKICPMLASTRHDWCHFYADWKEPTYLQKLDRFIGNDNRHLKLAYLILAKSGSYAKQYPHDYFRMVSNRMVTRGKTEVSLCGLSGGVRLMRLDRDRSVKNQDLDQSRRGDILQWEHSLDEKFITRFNAKLEKQSRIKIVK
ncbi:MAG: methyltransferase domain-containing protein [Deltaproteobacteria bacterium]|nr:methyltransferase domain-containing protein [Deltaproteobacteria bacterium]